MLESLTPRRIAVSAVLAAVAGGWRAYRQGWRPAVAYAAVFAVFGVVIFAVLAQLGLHAMALPFAGGFLLVGPVVLVGFFALRRALTAGRRAGVADVLGAFRQVPRGLWGLAAACSLLLLIWLTDAATVYSFMIGGARPVLQDLLRFHLWTSLMGAVMAFIVFNITAFAVPLLFDGRAHLVGAVMASVRAVFANPGAMLAWALVLAVATIATILVPPLLVVSLPCLAFASDLLYLQVYPPA